MKYSQGVNRADRDILRKRERTLKSALELGRAPSQEDPFQLSLMSFMAVVRWRASSSLL